MPARARSLAPRFSFIRSTTRAVASAAATRTHSRYTTIIGAMTGHCAVYRDGERGHELCKSPRLPPSLVDRTAAPVL